MRREDIIAKLKDLNIPEFKNNPELMDLVISRMIQESEQQAQEDVDVFKDLAQKRMQNIDGVPVPLSKAESRSFNQRMDNVLNEIDATEIKINAAIEQVKSRIDSAEPDLIVDISNSSKLKKASKNVFGKVLKELTYEDYLELLDMREEALRKEKESFKVE